MGRIVHDRVNRVPGLVYLPVDGARFRKGQVITLDGADEVPIGKPVVRDALALVDPAEGNAVGDAVFDAQLGRDNVFDACMLTGDYGSLSIAKRLTGQFPAGTPRQFPVTVTFSQQVSYTVDGVPVSEPSSTCELNIAAGQRVVVGNIDVSVRYDVTETLTQSDIDDGYSLMSITNRSGNVLADEELPVVVTNGYERPIAYGALSLSVNVFGSGYDSTKVFRIVVQFSEPVDYSVDGGAYVQPTDVYVARLRAGDSVVLGHILIGVAYSVVEAPFTESDRLGGYSNGVVTCGSGVITRDVTDSAVAGYLYAGATGTLTLSVDIDNGETGVALRVAVTFSAAVSYTVGGTSISGASSVYVAMLDDGGSVTLGGIPNGTAYAVSPVLTDGDIAAGYTSVGTFPVTGVIDSASPSSETVQFVRQT